MSSGYNKQVPINRTGTNRHNRPLTFLDPGLVKIDDRKPADFLDLARKMAQGIRFDDPNNKAEDRTWKDFFSGELGKGQAHQPHYALFLAFLELFQLSIDNLNTFTKRHLDFFYQKVLRFDKEPEIADKVHVVLGLAKNIEKHNLLKGTRFYAGQDATGRALEYELLHDTVFNQAKLVALKQLYLQSDTGSFRKSNTNRSETVQLEVVKRFSGKTVSDNASEDLTQKTPWNPFGHPGLPAVEIGWAISSPMLILKEGVRTIDFTIIGDYTGEDALLTDFSLSADSFKLAFSTENGWLEADIDPDKVAVNGGMGNQDIELGFRCTIPLTAPAICVFEEAEFSSPWPMVKFILNQDQPDFPYTVLKQIRLKSVSLKLKVEGIRELVLHNDQAALAPNRPFTPFGREAFKGANFYIGNAEVFQKPLEKLSIDLDWHNLPASDLNAHYRQYPEIFREDSPAAGEGNGQFTTAIHLLHEGIWKPLTPIGEGVGLFNTDATTTRKTIITHSPVKNEINHKTATIETSHLKQKRDIDLQKIEDFNITSQNGFIKLFLNGSDFGHKTFPRLQSAAMSKNNQEGGELSTLPHEPYTPTLAGIRLGYESEHVIYTSETIDQILHIHPFGWTPYKYFSDSFYLLPQYKGEGMLYLGLKDVKVPQALSILFQIVEGSAYPDVPLPEIEWSYLYGNEWVPFKDTEILNDSTNRFNRSGVVTLRLPDIMPETTGIFPPDLYWIQAKTLAHANGACEILDIRTQAATLVFTNTGNVSGPRAHRLPAHRITGMTQADVPVKSVNQPYPSFDGKQREEDKHFYLRVCERLRHKERAVTLWDYERLVLEAFPELYEAKCFKHSNLEAAYAPGSILMVVIADIRSHTRRHPFKPTTSLDVLDRVKRYLKELCPPYVDIAVKNPVFEEIRVSFLVRFREKANSGYYQQKLNKDIQRYLSPWAFAEDKTIVFGGTIYKSSLLNFVVQQPYVDFVTYFAMNHADAQGNLRLNVEEAATTTPVSVLVSAQSHDIRVAPDQATVCGDGIGSMIIGKTFMHIE